MSKYGQILFGRRALVHRLSDLGEYVAALGGTLYGFIDNGLNNADLEVFQNATLNHFALLAGNCPARACDETENRKRTKQSAQITHAELIDMIRLIKPNKVRPVHCLSSGLTLGVFMPFELNISISSKRSVLIS